VPAWRHRPKQPRAFGKIELGADFHWLIGDPLPPGRRWKLLRRGTHHGHDRHQQSDAGDLCCMHIRAHLILTHLRPYYV
jgi:hypothetical protein